MIVKSFEIDENVAKAFGELQSIFGVTTDAAVVARALGLARVASKVAGNERVVTLLGPVGKETIALNR